MFTEPPTLTSGLTSGQAGIVTHPVLSLIIVLALFLIVAGLSFFAGWRCCARRRDAEQAQFRSAWRSHSGMPSQDRS